MCVLVQRIYVAYKVVENSETIFRKKKLGSTSFQAFENEKREGERENRKEIEKESSNIKSRQFDKSWKMK